MTIVGDLTASYSFPEQFLVEDQHLYSHLEMILEPMAEFHQRQLDPVKEDFTEDQQASEPLLKSINENSVVN